MPNTFCYAGFDFEKTKQEIKDEDFDSGDETCEAFFPIDKFYDEDQIAWVNDYYQNIHGWHVLLEEMEQFFINPVIIDKDQLRLPFDDESDA